MRRGRHAAGRPPTLHYLRSFGSGVGGVPNFTTQCTCGVELQTPDVDAHNYFSGRHLLFYPSTLHVRSDGWAFWLRVAKRQGVHP